MRPLFSAIQAVLYVSDGVHELRANYHPIQDLHTYLESRKAS